MWRVALAWFVAASVAGAAFAQIVPRPEDLTATLRGMVARYEAALIRERRLADDREQHMIAAYEARLSQLTQSRPPGASSSDLREARTRYATAVHGIVQREADASRLTQAYERQLAQDLGSANAAQVDALQRFADGDLEQGFQLYREETERRRAARESALAEAAAQARVADAAEARQLAHMAETMRLNGLATAASVIALFEGAKALSAPAPEDWLVLARLYRETAQLTKAIEAADAGLAAASPFTAALIIEKGRVLMDAGDHAAARDAFIAARGLADETTGPQDFIAATYRLGDTLSRIGDRAAARQAYEAALAAARRFAGEGDDPVRQRELSVALEKAGDARLADGEFASALECYRERLVMARQLARANPSSVDLARHLALSYERMGDAYAELGQLENAFSAYRQRQDIIARLLAADPGSAVLLRDAWVSLWKLVQFPRSGVTWAQVAAAMEDTDRRGLLLESDRSTLARARANAGLDAR